MTFFEKVTLLEMSLILTKIAYELAYSEKKNLMQS